MHTRSSRAAALGLIVITVFTSHWQYGRTGSTLQRRMWRKLGLDLRNSTCRFLAEEMTEEEEALLRGVDALEYMLTASIMPDDFDIEALAAFGPEAAAGCCPLPATGFLATAPLAFLHCTTGYLPLPHWLSSTSPTAFLPLPVWLPALLCSDPPRGLWCYP